MSLTTPASELRVLRDTRSVLAESIVWDDRAEALLWCDIQAGTIHRGALDAPDDGSRDEVLRLEPPLASFFPTTDDGYVVSLRDRIVVTDAAGRVATVLAEIPHAPGDLRLNEGKVDPAGRWVTGSMDSSGDPDGALYSIASGGELRTLRGGLGTTNGIDWTPDGEHIYFTDTTTETIYRGAYTADGDIVDERAFASFGPHDGLTVDRDGHVWTALYGEGRVLRLDPDGELVQTVEVPVPNVTSVALVGPNLDVLAIGSARENLDEEQLARHPLSGALFGLDVPTPGRQPHRFAAARVRAR